MLENGDLIFVREDTEMGQAIQESTGHYSHVAIFLDGQVYHATVEGGVICQKPIDFFEPDYLYDIFCYPKIDIKKVKKEQTSIWELLIIFLFILMGTVSIVPNISQTFFLFLRPFP